VLLMLARAAGYARVTKQYELVCKAEISPFARSGTSGVKRIGRSVVHNGGQVMASKGSLNGYRSGARSGARWLPTATGPALGFRPMVGAGQLPPAR
jgi:hypothetical protein